MMVVKWRPTTRKASSIASYQVAKDAKMTAAAAAKKSITEWTLVCTLTCKLPVHNRTQRGRDVSVAAESLTEPWTTCANCTGK